MSQIFKLSSLIFFSFFWANIEIGEGKSIYIYFLSWLYVSDHAKTPLQNNQPFQIKQVGNAGKENQNIILEKLLCPQVEMFVCFGPIKLQNIKF